MRLTHIKLAGFKSFVDPTVIPVPAQLTGVVGPNGCGKSNVIDAVRWVLGESSAKHLRGETMQDVIFNGSGTRKPASRASVELAFNNELGRAAGQWSQYAEIAVKRVLDRSGESTYYINNMRVRRRDVADLFLGTGVGARAYAIIEQGMISKLIEAKPEELRGYLEEAAGVSKYKERRKETEARLKDARDNLNRVEDIQRELKHQVEKLTAQAEVAQHYKQLQADLTYAQHRLWYAKKHDAAQQRARPCSACAPGTPRRPPRRRCCCCPCWCCRHGPCAACNCFGPRSRRRRSTTDQPRVFDCDGKLSSSTRGAGFQPFLRCSATTLVKIPPRT